MRATLSRGPQLYFQIDTSIASPDLLTPPISDGCQDGEAALALNPRSALGFTSATDAISLPKPKPRAVGMPLIMPPIRSGEVAWAQRSTVRHREHALNALDFGNSLLGVHSPV